MDNYYRNKIILPKKHSKELAYICGILAGDGSINFRPAKYEYSIKCVGNLKDEESFYINIIKPKFRKLFGLELKIKKFNSEGTVGFVIYSKLLVNYLVNNIKLPLGVKYNTLKIPEVFLKDEKLVKEFIRGVFDTDGCISFKRKYKKKPYYPVITLVSKSSAFIKEISAKLKNYGFKIAELYNYKIFDYRTKKGFTNISRIDLNGNKNLDLWLKLINFYSPKHLGKINKYYKEV